MRIVSVQKYEFINISYWSIIKICHQNLLNGISIAAQKYANGKLIDIGCGMKPYEKIFTPYICSYFGVDFAATVESNYGSFTKADLFADCTDTKLEAESFDTLLSTQVMEHIYDTKKYIAECFRLLKNGGTGIFTIPQTWQCHAEPYDFYRFTKHSLERLFLEQGFKILELRPLEGAYAAIIQTKIVSVYFRKRKHIISKLLREFFRFVILPVLNLKALLLDKMFWNDKLCLNYILVVRK
jgi:SAM-dependent methyltransferase